MHQFRYRAFGLNIESEFEIPEFIPSTGEPDVNVCFGEVPSQLHEPLFCGVRFQASPWQFLLKVDHIANYFVEGGRSIIIQPIEQSDISDIRLFLLGSAFGSLFHQRGLLPLHGSSLNIGGKAYVFSGISGVGKSTLAAGLVKRGYELLNDDISVISLSENNTPVVNAGYPNMKLWADSIEKLSLDPENYVRVRVKLNKHNLHLKESFNSEALPVRGIYILHTQNIGGITFEKLKGIEKFNDIKNNTYRLNFLKGIGNTEAHFTHLSALSQYSFVKRVSRPSKGFLLDQLIDAVESDIQSENGSTGI